MSVNRMFIHVCDIISHTETQGATGAVETTPNGTVPCNCRFQSPIAKRGSIEPMRSLGQMVQTDKELYLPGTAVISTKHTVTNIRMRNDLSQVVDSSEYEVIEVKPRYARRKLHHISSVLKKVI